MENPEKNLNEENDKQKREPATEFQPQPHTELHSQKDYEKIKKREAIQFEKLRTEAMSIDSLTEWVNKFGQESDEVSERINDLEATIEIKTKELPSALFSFLNDRSKRLEEIEELKDKLKEAILDHEYFALRRFEIEVLRLEQRVKDNDKGIKGNKYRMENGKLLDPLEYLEYIDWARNHIQETFDAMGIEESDVKNLPPSRQENRIKIKK